MKVIVQVALTGCVHHKTDNPALPVTPDEVREDVRRCLNEGASVFHVHARDKFGNPTMDHNQYAHFVAAVMESGGVVNVSCSGRRGHAYWQRFAPLSVPGTEMASLSMGSMNFPHEASVNEPDIIRKLAGAMHERGIVPELECFEPGHVNYATYLISKDTLKPPHVFNLILGNLGTCPASRGWLYALIDMLPVASQWFGTGIGSYAGRMTKWALALGGHVRVGLEDTLWIDGQKQRPATNPLLVEQTISFARTLSRESATPDEAREILGL